MPGISSALAANSRFDRLEEANRDPLGPRACGGSGRRPVRLLAGPRVLSAGGSAEATAWQIADRGITSAFAYFAPELGGWYWVAVLGAEERGAAGAVLLTIGPDGKRSAERYGSEAEAWSDMEWIAAKAQDGRECATPAAFWQILEPSAEVVAMPEPVATVEPVAAAALEALPPVATPVEPREPLPWVAPVPELPEFAAIRARWADLVAAPMLAAAEAVTTSEPATKPAAPHLGLWQRVRQWIADQVAATVNPWLGHGFEFELPALVRLEESPVSAAD